MKARKKGSVRSIYCNLPSSFDGQGARYRKFKKKLSKVGNPKRTTLPTNMAKRRGSEVLAKKKKNSTVKLKPSSDLNINSLQLDKKKDMSAVQNKTSAVKLKPIPELIHSAGPRAVFRGELGELPVLSKKFQVPLKRFRSNSGIMKDCEMIISSPKSSPGPKAKSVTGSPFSSPTASLGSNGTSKTDILSGELTGTSKTAMGNVLTIPTASLSSKPSGTRIITPYPRKYSSLKLVFPYMDQYRKGKAESKKPISDKNKVKTIHVVEASSENKKLEPMQSDSTIKIPQSTSPLPPSPIKPIDENVQVKTLHVIEAATEDKPVRSDDTTEISQSTFPVSQLAIKSINDDVQVKTLHVVDEPTTENKILKPAENDSINQNSPSTSPVFHSPVASPSHRNEAEEHEYIDVKDVEHSDYSDGEYSDYSEYTDTYDSEESEYAESETDEFISENTDNVDTPKGQNKRSTRKGRQLTSEDKDSDMTKAKFRRGRIVELQSENNAPRKLKFRRGRVVENEDGSKMYARRRRFKKRETNNANGANGDSEHVVLRHQEQQGKVEQGSYNEVIEETATKLADVRKSKVRALVGAFETVIHLQDKTPQES